MTLKDVFTKWLEKSESDIQVAKSLFEKKHYIESLFFCHQSIEKALKGFFIKLINHDYPYIHDLPKLFQYIKNHIDEIPERHKRILQDINPFYIQARYPTYKEEIKQLCTKENTKILLKETIGFLKWLETNNK